MSVALPPAVETAITLGIPAGLKALERALPGAVGHLLLETHRDEVVEALSGWVRGLVADVLTPAVHVQAGPDATVTVKVD